MGSPTPPDIVPSSNKPKKDSWIPTMIFEVEVEFTKKLKKIEITKKYQN